MKFEKFCKVSGYLREKAELQLVFDKYYNREPFINKYIGIENINDDLVVWYENTDGELDCWVLDNYFTKLEKKLKLETLYNMWYESFKK